MVRVALTCDFLRYEVDGANWSNFQLRNLEWLYQLMGGFSEQGIDINVVVPPPDVDGLRSAMDNDSAVSEYVVDSRQAWASRYDVATLDVFPRLLDTLCAHDAVVGFELPPSIRRHLHRSGVSYLNIHVHPLRFLRDLCFTVTTNAPRIAARLATVGVPQREVDDQVRRFRALFRRRQLPSLSIPPGIPILIGQTQFDSVLIKDGQFASWSDYRAMLEAALLDDEELVFLEHPSRPSQADIVAFLRGALGKTVISTNANGYGVLFSASDVPQIMTLSSSLGVEAQAMGYSTHFLLDDPRQKFFLGDIETQVPDGVGHALLDAGFWRQLLAGDDGAPEAAPDQRADPFFVGDNYVRGSLDAWSYGAIQNGLGSMSSRKTLLPAATLGDSRRADLLGHLTQATTPLSPRYALQRAQALGIFLELSAPPQALGEISDAPLTISSPGSPLLTGFHAAEPWGRWSSERVSQIGWSIDPSAVGRSTLVLEMEIAAFDGVVGRAPVLSISFEDSVIGLVFFRPSQPKVAVRLQVQPRSSYCMFDLHFTDLQKPSASGNSSDIRDVGFALYRLTFTLQPAQSEDAEVGPLSLWGIGPGPLAPSGRVALA
jgi:hypothetical protein